MMYSAIKYGIENNKWRKDDPWFHIANHGVETAHDYLLLSDDLQDELYEFLGSLPLFCRIKGKKNEASYVIVHALAPTNALTAPKIPTLKDIESRKDLQVLKYCLQYRKSDKNLNIHIPNISIQEDNVITIIGHTPVEELQGYRMEEDGHLLMIDGGCSYIAQNPNSIRQTEMLTVARLSPTADEIAFGTYGGSKEKILRQPAKKI